MGHEDLTRSCTFLEFISTGLFVIGGYVQGHCKFLLINNELTYGDDDDEDDACVTYICASRGSFLRPAAAFNSTDVEYKYWGQKMVKNYAFSLALRSDLKPETQM